MKVLTVDIGNTSIDLCLYEEGRLKHLGKYHHQELLEVPADLVLVSSVKPSVEDRVLKLYPKAEFIRSAHVPVETAFEGKERVGVDRLLNLYGAIRLFSENVLIVSCGTALVVDLAVEGIFQGGFIVPGLRLSLECLSQKAELIPLLELERLFPDIGRDTKTALLGGVLNQAKAFILQCLESWQESYKRELKVVLTGGDGWVFEELGVYDPLLLHKAMLLLKGFYSSF